VLGIICLFLPLAAQPRLWHDPSTRSGGVPAPRAPFTFLREDPSGTQTKFFVHDASGATWNVKFGNEVKNESFCWRIVQACGYFAEPGFFVAEGQIQGWKPLRRPSPSVTPDGHFANARFQYRDPNLEFLKDRNWRWDAPPFAGTKELSGLKILIMLFSNWDNKDARAGKGGPNTAVFRRKDGTPSEPIYAFTDWGSGMGFWGSKPGAETNWRCADFRAQTPSFVKGVEGGRVVFGWEGAINEGFKDNILPAHVGWLMQYLDAVTEDEWLADLKAAGATDEEAVCFAGALLQRVDQLRKVGRYPAP